jgi:hypothetical protein
MRLRHRRYSCALLGRGLGGEPHVWAWLRQQAPPPESMNVHAHRTVGRGGGAAHLASALSSGVTAASFFVWVSAILLYKSKCRKIARAAAVVWPVVSDYCCSRPTCLLREQALGTTMEASGTLSSYSVPKVTSLLVAAEPEADAFHVALNVEGAVSAATRGDGDALLYECARCALCASKQVEGVVAHMLAFGVE